MAMQVIRLYKDANGDQIANRLARRKARCNTLTEVSRRALRGCGEAVFGCFGGENVGTEQNGHLVRCTNERDLGAGFDVRRMWTPMVG